MSIWYINQLKKVPIVNRYIPSIWALIRVKNTISHGIVWNSGFLFQRTGNIVKKSGRNEDLHIYTFCFSDLYAKAGDTECVIKTMWSWLSEEGISNDQHPLSLSVFRVLRNAQQKYGFCYMLALLANPLISIAKRTFAIAIASLDSNIPGRLDREVSFNGFLSEP